ncbi:MAG: CopG family transcriptional regulator [Pseudomonadota bacterium]
MVYFEPDIYNALRTKTAYTNQSLSEFVNEEDQEDLNAFEERATEPTLSYEELLKDLKCHGKL